MGFRVGDRLKKQEQGKLVFKTESKNRLQNKDSNNKNNINVIVGLKQLGKDEESTILELRALAFNIENGDVISSFGNIINVTAEEELKISGEVLSDYIKYTPKEFKDTILNGVEEGNKKTKTTLELLKTYSYWLTDLKQKTKSNNLRYWYLTNHEERALNTQLQSKGLSYNNNNNNNAYSLNVTQYVAEVSKSMNSSTNKVEEEFRASIKYKNKPYLDNIRLIANQDKSTNYKPLIETLLYYKDLASFTFNYKK